MQLNEHNFQEETKDGLVLVDFYTAWCQPCRMLAPILEKLTNVKVCKVDVEQENKLGARYGATAVPTLVFFKNGQPVDHMVGLQSQSILQQKIDMLSSI